MAYIRVISVGSESVTVSLAGLMTSYESNDRRLEWYVDGSYRAYRNLSGGISESPSQTLYNLSPGTSYTITAIVSAPGFEQDYEWDTEIETTHLTPSISSFTASQTAIAQAKARCVWSASNLESDAEYEIEAQDSKGTWWVKASGRASTSGDATISFDEFRTYSLRLTIYNGNKSASRTTSVTLISVLKWNWYSSNSPDYNASAEQTAGAYAAVSGKGRTTDFSYCVWNDMCAKVREIRAAVGGIGAWDRAYGTYEDALMSSSDHAMTAARFNNLKNQIGSQIGTGIKDVSTGDIVYGSYFITIANRINDWIDLL